MFGSIFSDCPPSLSDRLNIQMHSLQAEIPYALKTRMTDLAKHTIPFMNEEGYYTIPSIKRGFSLMGYHSFSAYTHAIGIYVILNAKMGLFPHFERIHLAKHLNDTGIFDAEGNVNQDRLEEVIKKYSRVIPAGIRILTQDKIEALIEDNQLRDIRHIAYSDDYYDFFKRTRNFTVLDIGNKASHAEFALAFDQLSDIEFEGRKALTVEKFKSLYLEGSEFFEKTCLSKKD